MTLKEFKVIQDLLTDDCEILIVRKKKKGKKQIGFVVPDDKEVVPVHVHETK